MACMRKRELITLGIVAMFLLSSFPVLGVQCNPNEIVSPKPGSPKMDGVEKGATVVFSIVNAGEEKILVAVNVHTSGEECLDVSPGTMITILINYSIFENRWRHEEYELTLSVKKGKKIIWSHDFRMGFFGKRVEAGTEVHIIAIASLIPGKVMNIPISAKVTIARVDGTVIKEKNDSAVLKIRTKLTSGAKEEKQKQIDCHEQIPKENKETKLFRDFEIIKNIPKRISKIFKLSIRRGKRFF